MADYVGDFKSTEGTEMKREREDKEISIHQLREKVKEKLEQMAEEDDDIDTHVDIEFSATIRRVEDGFDEPDHIADAYSKSSESYRRYTRYRFFQKEEESEEKDGFRIQRKTPEVYRQLRPILFRR